MRSIDRRLSDLESKVGTEPAMIVVVWSEAESAAVAAEAKARGQKIVSVEWDESDEAGASQFEWRLEKVYGGDENG